MGYTMVPDELLEDPRIEKHDLLVYLALRNHARNESLTCWPSIRRVAATGRISPTTAEKSLARLVTFGYITKRRRQKANRKTGQAGRRRDSNFYAFRNVPQDGTLERSNVPQDGTSRHPNVPLRNTLETPNVLRGGTLERSKVPNVPQGGPLNVPRGGKELDEIELDREAASAPPEGTLAASLQPRRDESLARPLRELVKACQNGTIADLAQKVAP